MSKTAREVLDDYVPDAALHDSLTQDDADQIIADLDAAGFVIVPKAPTEAMINAVPSFHAWHAATREKYSGYYRAMIAASQEPKP